MIGNNQDIVKFEFYRYLSLLDIAPVSLKNYKSDINYFLNWLISGGKRVGHYIESLKDIVPFLDVDLSKKYKEYLLNEKIPFKTINRRLSILRHLSKFLTTERIVNTDFMKGIENISMVKTRKYDHSRNLIDFVRYLESEKVSQSTIKNYLNDTKQFIVWVDSLQTSDFRHQTGEITKTPIHIIQAYLTSIADSGTTSTVRRKSASLNKFFDWAVITGRLSKNPIEIEIPNLKQINFSKNEIKPRLSPSIETLKIVFWALFLIAILLIVILNIKNIITYIISIIRPVPISPI